MLNDLPGNFGARLMERLERIARVSEEGPGVTRLPFTEQHREANRIITEWMEAAGLEVRMDAAATLIGRRGAANGARTLLIGSHQDSIRHGGCFDGILGIALPILVLESLKDRDLPVSVEVLAFADEEGVRFPTALIGPRALAGTLKEESLALAERGGTALADALRDFGGDPQAALELKRDPAGLVGYVEAHIEQGPALESEGLALGVVRGICGIERWRVRLTGEAAHAGTTPMNLRRDALAGAAELVLALEGLAGETEDLVGTVGELSVTPNVANAVPGAVDLVVELRALEDGIRERAGARLEDEIAAIASRRGLDHAIDRSYAQNAAHCDQALTDRLAKAVEDSGHEPKRMMSGATHDASAMADLCPVAMLFVRCKDGISHHPDEAVSEADLAAAGAALRRFILSLSQ